MHDLQPLGTHGPTKRCRRGRTNPSLSLRVRSNTHTRVARPRPQVGISNSQRAASRLSAASRAAVSAPAALDPTLAAGPALQPEPRQQLVPAGEQGMVYIVQWAKSRCRHVVFRHAVGPVHLWSSAAVHCHEVQGPCCSRHRRRHRRPRTARWAGVRRPTWRAPASPTSRPCSPRCV